MCKVIYVCPGKHSSRLAWADKPTPGEALIDWGRKMHKGNANLCHARTRSSQPTIPKPRTPDDVTPPGNNEQSEKTGGLPVYFDCLPSIGRDLKSGQLCARSVEKVPPIPISSRPSGRLPRQPQTCRPRTPCADRRDGGGMIHMNMSADPGVIQPATLQRRVWFRPAIYIYLI